MSRVIRRSGILFTIVAMMLAIMPAALAAPQPVAPTSGGEWTAPGPGVVVNETGEPGEDVYIILHQAPSLAQYRGEVAGLAATSPDATGAARLDVDSAASVSYRSYLAGQHDALIGVMEAQLGRALDVRFRYEAVLNGFAVVMNADEALAISSLAGIRRVERDSTRELQTDNGPRWIGADAVWGEDPVDGATHCVGTCGEGVVAGIIDTGVNFDHPSFAEVGGDGYVHSNPKGQFFGACDPITGLPFCNDKLIGFYDFSGTGPEDDNGHGSHTASTTAGNVLTAVLQAPTITVERDISGVAPHANVISYKGCSGTPVGCLLSALVASINQATLDEVDVINYSIGGSSANPWEDLDAQAFFDAYTAGIFVATSASNDGPGFGTLGSPADAPWVTSVGASTHDRALANGIVDMTNADTTAGPADIFGASLTAPLPARRVVYAGDYGAPLCGAGTGDPATGEGSGGNPFPPGTFNGEIVVCDRGEYGRVHKSDNVAEAGAGGYVLANDAANGDSLVGDAYPIPGVHISYADGVVLKNWIAANGGLAHQGTARINGSNPTVDPANADIMASFSSRGANPAAPSLIKPDVTAPGVDILAAWMTAAGTLPGGDPEFNIISGTSMSSPHTAGSGALVRAAHPDWSPDEVKSALMTTAFNKLPGNQGETHVVLKEDRTTPADPFDMGSGRVDLHEAALAGVVFDESAAGYDAANPALGGDATTLNIASLGNDFCVFSCSWTRSMTGTVGSTLTWTPSATGPAGMVITFDQPSYTVAPGATVDFTVTANVDGVVPKGNWTFAEVQLTPSDSSIPTAHLPVAVIPVGGQQPVVLRMHGNLHDDCTGVGFTDVAAGAGVCQPFLSADDLDTSPAASYGPINATVDGTAPQNLYDPNWIWNLDEETTLQGPMTVEYWYTSPNKETVFNLDFTIRLFADGVLVAEDVVRHNSLVPETELFRDTISIPKVTATTSFVVQIDPFFVTQNGAFIYYDSTQPCPGSTSSAECNSRVSMPVVDRTDNPPEANDDSAFVPRGGTVIIDVLANDFDAEGPLAVTIVSGPSNGTADVTLDNRISYTHNGSATVADSLLYEVTDTGGQKDTATVDITIADQCFKDAGGYADDFESGAPGWTVDTAVITAPSQTWTLLSPDPFATSGDTVWFTDALAGNGVDDTTKDVRLVSPEFIASGTSHLTFWHRFRTEAGFDGGVLEVSTGGGAWMDVVDAGGVFVAGAYNDTIAAGSAALGGRNAWAGESAGFLDGDMNQVDVDLGALAGQTIQVRFRFGQDILLGEVGGWWIDDVALDNLLAECFPPNAGDDAATVDAGDTVNVVVLANDSDPDNANSELTVTIESGAASGTVAVLGDGSIDYTHNGDTATSDAFQYRITDPDGNFDIATVTVTIVQPPNPAPVAMDDEATVNAGQSVTVDVKANDSDANHTNDQLTVTIESSPASGTAGVNGDGSVTYTHNGDTATSDSFQYRVTDPLGAFDIGTVSVEIVHDPDSASDKVTGGGYLLPTDGKKINFGFNAKAKGQGFQGHLTLNDKTDGVKVRLDTVTDLGAVQGACGSVAAGADAAEFRGTGTFNGSAASFRVCVADLGEPGNSGSGGADLFYLECTAGCSYSTGDRTADDVIDGGNIQVHRSATPDEETEPGAAEATESAAGEPEATEAESATEPTAEPEATVLILDPMLVTDGVVGETLELTVTAYGPDSELVSGASVVLTIKTVTGTVTLDGLSDAGGLVTFVTAVVAGDTEFQAHSGQTSSNTIDVTAL